MPPGVQGYDRYAYVSNNPLRYTDPTGHMEVEDRGSTRGSLNCRKYAEYCNNGKPKSSEELLATRPTRCITIASCYGGFTGAGFIPVFPPFLRLASTASQNTTSTIPDIVQAAGDLFTQVVDIFDYGASALIKTPYAPYRYHQTLLIGQSKLIGTLFTCFPMDTPLKQQCRILIPIYFINMLSIVKVQNRLISLIVA